MNATEMKFLVLLLFLLLKTTVFGYKPVVLIHGIMTGAPSMELIKNRIQEIHPGTVVYNIDRFGGWSSLDNMWYQVIQIGADLINITRLHPEGINLLGYSQGGLLARAVLQTYPEHNVKTFISLSSPQAGQYGTAFLHIIFPHLALKTAYELFYSRLGQHTSVGNYWNDPNHQNLYQNYSEFLPYVNNEILSGKSGMFKAGLLKLHQFVLIGGPDDGVITPWESSQFGYYGENGTIETLTNRDIYINDKIGLKTLGESGKLVLVTVPGVTHFMWHINASIIDDFILRYLD